MDNLTHSLVGALIGQAGLKRKTGLAMPALIIGANLPDIDATCTIYGIESLAMRRGLTHGPIAWVVLPLLLAGILWWFDRWQARRGKRPEGRLPVHFGWLFALAFIACLSHPLMDWMNNYGIRFLEPFSHQWFYGDTLFIIDIWLWLGMGFATWLSLRREKRGGDWRKPAQIALVAATLYIGGNLALSRSMIAANPDSPIVIPGPVPVAFWQRELISGDGNGIWLVDGQRVGDIPLSHCRLEALRKTDSRLDALLFWSRAPFVQHIEGGGWVLGDARFYSPLTRGRFSVDLPKNACRA